MGLASRSVPAVVDTCVRVPWLNWDSVLQRVSCSPDAACAGAGRKTMRTPATAAKVRPRIRPAYVTDVTDGAIETVVSPVDSPGDSPPVQLRHARGVAPRSGRSRPRQHL